MSIKTVMPGLSLWNMESRWEQPESNENRRGIKSWRVPTQSPQQCEKKRKAMKVRVRIGKNSSTHGILLQLFIKGTLSPSEVEGIPVMMGDKIAVFWRLVSKRLVYETAPKSYRFALTTAGEMIAKMLPEFEGYQYGWKEWSGSMYFPPTGYARVKEWFIFDLHFFQLDGKEMVEVTSRQMKKQFKEDIRILKKRIKDWIQEVNRTRIVMRELSLQERVDAVQRLSDEYAGIGKTTTTLSKAAPVLFSSEFSSTWFNKLEAKGQEFRDLLSELSGEGAPDK